MPRYINSLRTRIARIPQRMMTCALIFGATLLCYMNRAVYYAAITEMTYEPPAGNATSVSPCRLMISNDIFSNHHKTEYYWNVDLTHAITQAFFIGFLITNIPSGIMADFYGAKGFLGTGLLGSSVITIIHPTLASFGPFYLMLGRFFHGICQSMVWTSGAVMVAQWAPHSERTTFMSIIEAGQFCGIVASHILTRNLKPVRESWEAKFYTAGVLGVLWSVGWYLLVYAEPARCPHMSDAERALIESQTEGFHKDDTMPYPNVPWKQMFQSQPFLALQVYHIGSSWIHFGVTNQIVPYLSKVVNMTQPLSTNCSIIAVCAGVFALVYFGALGDWLINHKHLTTIGNRKLFGLLGNVLAVPLMFGILLAGCDGLLVTSLYVVMFYVRGIAPGAIHANVIDLSPQFAGVSMGIMNCGSAVASLFSRELYRYICDNESDPAKWFLLYLINTVVLIVTCLPFLWKGSGEIQYWNYSTNRP